MSEEVDSQGGEVLLVSLEEHIESLEITIDLDRVDVAESLDLVHPVLDHLEQGQPDYLGGC